MSSGGTRQPVLGWVIGVGLLVGLVALTHYSVGWETLLTPWREISPGVLGGAFSLVLGSYALRTVRVHDYFHPATSGRFLRTFRLVLVHNLFNNLLPMRSGEASFPILMARDFRVPFSRSIPGLLYLRVLDLHFVLLLGVVVLAWERGALSWILALLLAPIPYGIFRAKEWLGAHLAGADGRVAKVGREALLGLPGTSTLFWKTWLWTAVNWTVKLMVFAWILRAFTPMPFSHALLGSTTGELSSVLPFHGIAGAGTYEAGVLASLVPLGVELEAALKAAVNLHLFVLGASIVAGAMAALAPIVRKNPGGTPTGEAPTGEAPMGEAPMGEAPMGEAPTGEAPVGEAPVGEAPMGEAPVGEAPTGEAPMGEAPTAKAPLGETTEDS